MVKEFQVGIITSTHGLKGEVKVFPTTDDPQRFLDLEEVILEKGRIRKTLRIRSVKFFKKYVILGFEGMDRIEDVERLRGSSLLIDRKDALPLEEGEYYIPDLLGLKVVTREGEEDVQIGTLKDVLMTGANDVYVVEKTDGGELLIPVIEQCIKEVNLEEGFVRVWIMPGLEDL
ncbi:MAG: 16S rRNA processing protein RimM [Lachnospiraceae bacterium]|jgi:16S rRNA processing protein RimM|nr:16S rRNA processing protein RimM [Lachnospiraceae bacterium]MBQ5360020.1 16S rRNA processing protein RimM [Lachnospiraceae bacterium]